MFKYKLIDFFNHCLAIWAAPSLFIPKICYRDSNKKCSIWNCKYHYFDNKYVYYCTR